MIECPYQILLAGLKHSYNLKNLKIKQLKKNILFLLAYILIIKKVHIILGAGDVARIKTGGFIAGISNEPMTEKN